jgi:hypothetical protein
MNEGCLVGKDLQRLLNATSTTTTVVVVAVVANLLTAPSLHFSFFSQISVLLKFLLLAGTEMERQMERQMGRDALLYKDRQTK